MPASARSIEDIIASEVDKVVSRFLPVLERALAEARRPAAASAARRGAGRRRRPRQDLTRWVADKRARRVPNFVIELTGLDTKKKIVARYGEDTAFEKGKPAPRPKAAVNGAGRPVAARPPVIHKAAAAK